MTSKELKKMTLTVVNLVDKWHLNESEKSDILGFPPENIPAEISSEQEQRLSLLLNIHAELRLLFNSPNNIYGYMTMINRNSPFNGKRPADLACESLVALYSVYEAIKQIRTL